MDVSEKQLAANRQNAQKSTGPKSEEGKRISSRNAIKHGLYSRDIIIDSPALKEDPEEYQSLLQSLIDEFLPVGEMEECLVTKMANCLWRGRRAIRAETAQIQRQMLYNTPVDPTKPLDHDARRRLCEIGVDSIPCDHINLNILRYEMRLDRQLSWTYSLLICLQKRRKDDMMEGLKLKNI